MPERPAKHSKPRAGIPLGGAGAGSIEFGPDACFRNVSINNNRLREQVLPLAGRSFLALRAAGATPYARVLQLDAPDLPRWRSSDAPPRLKAKHFPWRGLYPVANYALQDPESPVRVVVSAFSPIIPFDYDASVLPMVLFGVRLENLSDVDQQVSVLLNVECLAGRTAANPAATAIEGGPVLALEEIPRLTQSTTRRSLDKDAPAPELPPPPRYNGIEMGSPNDLATNAGGQYCVAAKPGEGIDISLMAWDTESAAEEAILWRHFIAHGNFDTVSPPQGPMRAAAVCAQVALAPGETRRADLVFAWYCPRFEVDGIDQGNGYTNRMKSAVEVAKIGLRNVDYYYASVEGWRGRLKASSLPRWLNDACIGSCQVLTTNALYTREGRFGLMEHARDTRAGRLGLRRYHALGTLLFFPRFEDSELTVLAAAEDTLHEKRFPEHMGRLCLHQPDFRNVDPDQVDLACEFVLSAFRNFYFTGNLARLRALLPRLQEAMTLAAGRDRDGDGLPEISPAARTYDGIALQGLNVITCGLWLTTLRAYARIADQVRLPDEAQRYRAIFSRAQQTFEALFWVEDGGYYRLYFDTRFPREEQERNSAVCHSAQLTGQWYADFLGLGPLHDRVRITRALGAIARWNNVGDHLNSAVMPGGGAVANEDGTPNTASQPWPAYTTAHYACLQILRGNVETGLRAAEANWRRVHTYDGPHDPPNSPSRHAAALSVWYLLYALAGLELNLAESCLRIMPRLPEGTHSLETLLFTPACLGWLRYHVDEFAGAYRQRLHLSLDSPVTLQRIELRVPANIVAASVKCELPDGAFETTTTLEPDDGAKRLIITTKRPQIANTALSIEILGRR